MTTVSEGASYECFESGWCSEPVCRGQDCSELGAFTGGVRPKRVSPTHRDAGALEYAA